MAKMEEMMRAARVRRFRALELRSEGKTYREIGILIGRFDDPSIPVSGMMATFLVRRAVREVLHPSRRGHPLRAYAETLFRD